MDGALETAGTLLSLTEQPAWADIVRDAAVHGWKSETIFMIWGPLFPIAIFISLFFLAIIVYCVIRIRHIRHLEHHIYHKAHHTVEAEDIPRTQLRWNRVMEHANSEDENKWRLAILEADIMLNELLDVQGYKGDTIADKMRQVNRATFNSIDAAWDAHKVRNRVAHEGSEHQLTEREKNQVIGAYARVFHEFGFI